MNFITQYASFASWLYMYIKSKVMAIKVRSDIGINTSLVEIIIELQQRSPDMNDGRLRTVRRGGVYITAIAITHRYSTTISILIPSSLLWKKHPLS